MSLNLFPTLGRTLESRVLKLLHCPRPDWSHFAYFPKTPRFRHPKLEERYSSIPQGRSRIAGGGSRECRMQARPITCPTERPHLSKFTIRVSSSSSSSPPPLIYQPASISCSPDTRIITLLLPTLLAMRALSQVKEGASGSSLVAYVTGHMHLRHWTVVCIP